MKTNQLTTDHAAREAGHISNGGELVSATYNESGSVTIGAGVKQIGARAAWSARCDCRNDHNSSSGRCNNRDITDPTRVADESNRFAACEACRKNCPCGNGPYENLA